MTGDDDGPQFGPVLRRITVLVVVLTAIPVMLWVITSMVRDYLGPPSLPHFRQLTSVKPSPATPAAEDRDEDSSATEPATIEARASMTDAHADDRDDGAPKGPYLGERTPETATSPSAPPPAPVGTIDQGSLQAAAQTAAQRAAMLPGGSAALSGPVAATPPASVAAAPPPWPQPNQLPSPSASALQQQAAVAPPDNNDEAPSGTPLSGKIPLPRKRPHIDTHLAQAAIPSASPSSPNRAGAAIPMPRPRPSAAGAASAAPADDNDGSPLNFLQNLLH